jgi:hypothetical protein
MLVGAGEEEGSKHMVVNARDAPRPTGMRPHASNCGVLLRSRRSQAVQPTSVNLEPGTRATGRHGFSFAVHGDLDKTHTNSPYAHSHANPCLVPSAMKSAAAATPR